MRVPMGRLSSVIGAVAAARRRSSTFPFHPACRRISATSALSFSSANSARSCSGCVSGGAKRVEGWPSRTARCCWAAAGATGCPHQPQDKAKIHRSVWMSHEYSFQGCAMNTG